MYDACSKNSFSHPDYTVGSSFPLDPPLGYDNRTGHGLRSMASSPSVGNFTRPRRNLSKYVIFLFQYNTIGSWNARQRKVDDIGGWRKILNRVPAHVFK